ncbi:DUF2061 domain-containing protein [Marixanthomonas sp. SCSIO 43207]|uniref:DUF2061 domain-containing protein n=1 Tax=Marixanthomonas sp. SCSIO 43207 TaxID=2779360 RepID=UPI001CA9A699|nr:DUF2061 domain-containing protein [Marixanthomonas sp. SCSIO 43207]UAB80413.1 DUF2061 domain-containing protein [Marixanthomonas sp. SCSIO 43207]
MAQYKRESHYRSILKGISWRCIATADTILVVLLITCLNGNCSIDSALKIGFFEFFIKLAVYYVHERIWQKILYGKEVNPRQTLYKTISWRIIATTGTFIISGVILNSFDEIALFVAITELVSKFILYYIHERLWLRLPLGKIRNFFLRK